MGTPKRNYGNSQNILPKVNYFNMIINLFNCSLPLIKILFLVKINKICQKNIFI